jgi:dihydroflavonol-4-reductase
VGLNFVHVDDVAEGIVLALDRGRIGESYVLGGELATLREVLATAARLAGRRPPRFELPAWAVKGAIPLGPLVGRAMGTGPNLRELIAAADSVTYWASDEKARRELGYAPRDLEAGLVS